MSIEMAGVAFDEAALAWSMSVFAGGESGSLFSASKGEAAAGGTGAKSARRAPRKATGGKQRAMVIDDVPEVADMLSFMLRSSGYEVVVVFSAPAALAAARKERFDVVISDIGMPGMTGYELAKGLRQLPEYRTVPLIAVTGFNDYSDRQRALHAGFNAFLMKPIDPPALMDLIAGLTD